jgi:SAM-dependent methyltransferase
MSEETFDRIADHYDHALPAHVVEHYLRKRAAYVNALGPPGKGLDVGCGTGALAGRLAAAGWAMTGVDPSQGMLDVMARSHPEVDGFRGEGSELPFEADEFDLVLTVAALHHIAEPAAVRSTLIEMSRVCKPGGSIVVWDHNPRNPYWTNLMKRVPQDDGSERLIPEEEVVSGLRAGGAEVIAADQLGLVPDFVPSRFLGLAQAGERLAERTPGLRRLCAHNVILARPSAPA